MCGSLHPFSAYLHVIVNKEISQMQYGILYFFKSIQSQTKYRYLNELNEAMSKHPSPSHYLVCPCTDKASVLITSLHLYLSHACFSLHPLLHSGRRCHWNMRRPADTQRALQAVERLQAKLKERGEVPTEEKLSLLKSVLQSPLFHQILALQKSVQHLRDQVT